MSFRAIRILPEGTKKYANRNSDGIIKTIPTSALPASGSWGQKLSVSISADNISTPLAYSVVGQIIKQDSPVVKR
jgi:hypothetical protein